KYLGVLIDSKLDHSAWLQQKRSALSTPSRHFTQCWLTTANGVPEPDEIMSKLQKVVASLTDRLRSLDLENQAFNKEVAPPKVYVNQRPLCRTSSMDPADTFRGFINQLELVFQLQDKRYDTDRKKIATLGTLLTDKALSWYNPYIEQPERYAYDLSSWSAFKARMKATFGEINQEQVSETKTPGTQTSGLSSEIKDHLVHCESPVSLAAAMDQAIRIDNRIFERRQEQQYNPRSFRRNPPPNTPVSRIQPQQYQQRYVDNYSRLSKYTTFCSDHFNSRPTTSDH
ncbi:hypothetical protein BASA62_001854, partial [Batrachochytrium salamandrivorans]